MVIQFLLTKNEDKTNFEVKNGSLINSYYGIFNTNRDNDAEKIHKEVLSKIESYFNPLIILNNSIHNSIYNSMSNNFFRLKNMDNEDKTGLDIHKEYLNYLEDNLNNNINEEDFTKNIVAYEYAKRIFSSFLERDIINSLNRNIELLSISPEFKDAFERVIAKMVSGVDINIKNNIENNEIYEEINKLDKEIFNVNELRRIAIKHQPSPVKDTYEVGSIFNKVINKNQK